MGSPSLMSDWPANSALVIYSSSEGESLAEGDREEIRSWASVTKLAVALGVARVVQRGESKLSDPMGPPDATLAHMLAHASGLGAEQAESIRPVGQRRIYSNVGIDLAVAGVLRDREPAEWLDEEVFAPLDMRDAHLAGRASSGAVGSLNSLVTLGRTWLEGEFLFASTRELFTTPFLPELAGVVPGFGRFDPCPWALGPEVHGAKNHWMGREFSPRAFGHFGQSGALVLVEPDLGVVVAAAASEPFGPWASALWPRWSDRVHNFCVSK